MTFLNKPFSRFVLYVKRYIQHDKKVIRKVEKELHTNLKSGLTHEEARKRFEEQGYNKFQKRKTLYCALSF